MEYMTSHENVINETVATMNSALMQLDVPLIVRGVRRSNVIWQ